MQYLCRGARYYKVSKSSRCLCYRNQNTDSKTMVRILNVAEKNDAAKSLADIMSSGRYRRVRMPTKLNWLFLEITSELHEVEKLPWKVQNQV